MKRRKLIITIFIAALLLRFVLLFIDYSWDVNNHISWAEDLWKFGFSEQYFSTISSHVFGSKYPNYPPLALYIFYLLYPIQKAAMSFVWWANVTYPAFPSKLVFFVESKRLLAGVFKLPSIAADFGTAWILYLFAKKMVKTNHEKLVIGVSLAYLFNPIIFYNSAFWGQIDGLTIFFVMASVYLALYTKKTIPSMLLFVAALLIKPNPLIFIPIYAYILLKKQPLKDVAIGGLACFVFFYLTYLPFNSHLLNPLAPFTIYWDKAVQGLKLEQVSNSAFNFWTLILPNTGILETKRIFGSFTYSAAGYMLFGLSLLGSFFVVLKDKNFNRAVIYGLFFSSICSFLFLTKMHERFVLYFIPFLLLLVVQNRRLLPVYILLTVEGFLNMYNSWPVPRIEWLKMILESGIGFRFLSLVILGGWVWVLIRIKKTSD